MFLCLMHRLGSGFVVVVVVDGNGAIHQQNKNTSPEAVFSSFFVGL